MSYQGMSSLVRPSVNRLSAPMSCRTFDCLYRIVVIVDLDRYEVTRGRAMRAKREKPLLPFQMGGDKP